MKNVILKTIICILLLISIFLFMFPYTSKKINQYQNEEKLKSFTNDSEIITDKEKKERKNKNIDYSTLYQDSLRYNNMLLKNQKLGEDFSCSALDLSEYNIKDDIYGYIIIPKISLTCPIYLGASEYNMSRGITHMYNTSLPFYSNYFNIALSGHTGYMGENFFDYLPSLKENDSVYIRNHFSLLHFTVDKYMITENNDAKNIYLTEKDKKLTLITCSDNGTRRYMVICKFISSSTTSKN